MTILQELALRNTRLGNDPDLAEWPEEDQRAAVVELFEQKPDWFADALMENLASIENERLGMLDTLKYSSASMRQAALGRSVELALVSYPLDHLTLVCQENIYRWRAEEDQIRYETQADSAAEEDARRKDRLEENR